MNFEINAEDLQIQIKQKFKEYTWSDIKIKNNCDMGFGSKITLNNTQKFITEFFKPENPNGMLLWHSVGSGKTLTAVATLKKFEERGFNTLWITRTTLKKDLDKALKMIPLSKNLTVLSYKQFSNVGKGKGEIYNILLRKAQKINPNTKDPLFKTVLVIDECHKLYTKDLKPQEMHDIKSIQKMIFDSYENSMDLSCKVLLMSATPITSNPLEIINLFNLIIEKPFNRFNLETFKNDYLTEEGKFTFKGKKYFKDISKDLVSYIDMSKDPRKFAQISYNEVYVPYSSPKFTENFEESKDKCQKGMVYCTDVLNNDRKVCKDTFDRCKAEVEKNKKLYKNSKFQSKILSEKCNLKIT